MISTNFFRINKEMIKDLDLKEIGLLNLLCSFADNNTGICYPSYETLMKRSKINRKNTLSKLLKSLAKKGKISIDKNKTKGKFSNNIYTITEYQKRYTDKNSINKGFDKGNMKNSQYNQYNKPSIVFDNKPSIVFDTLTITNNNYNYNEKLLSYEMLINNLSEIKRRGFVVLKGNLIISLIIVLCNIFIKIYVQLYGQFLILI